MTKREREGIFERAATSNPLCGIKTKISKGYGASNALMVVDSGLELIDADLAGVREEQDGFLLLAGTTLPPNDELYVAVYIKAEADKFHQRLQRMVEIGNAQADGDNNALTLPAHNVRNNNCAIVVTWEDGKLYLRNKGHWNDDVRSIELNKFGPGIAVDRVAVAVYPPSRDAARSLNVRTYISYIAKLFRQDKIHEIHPWESGEADFESFKVKLEEFDLAELRSRIQALGCY